MKPENRSLADVLLMRRIALDVFLYGNQAAAARKFNVSTTYVFNVWSELRHTFEQNASARNVRNLVTN